jgi:hypothetical protein
VHDEFKLSLATQYNQTDHNLRVEGLSNQQRDIVFSVCLGFPSRGGSPAEASIRWHDDGIRRQTLRHGTPFEVGGIVPRFDSIHYY